MPREGVNGVTSNDGGDVPRGIARKRYVPAVGPGLNKLLTVVFGLFALLVVNSVYLVSVTIAGVRYQNWFYLNMFLLHLVLGLAIILLVIPFALIGITFGLLIFDVPFGFVALLGAMSLAGMMIKNSVVLLDQVNINIADGVQRYDALLEAAVSRLRPVMLAAATTVLGVIPLLQDVFWLGLAITLMAGLTFGSILTMVLVPVLYATVFRLDAKDAAAPAEVVTA